MKFVILLLHVRSFNLTSTINNQTLAKVNKSLMQLRRSNCQRRPNDCFASQKLKMTDLEETEPILQ